jgi:NADP-dependent 3-hydroxy acid dehydrogenase YdfG
MDILINNAGLALGAPAAFPDLSIPDITTMVNTNINGLMYVTYAVLNRSMLPRKPGVGTILNITSITGLEVPPFPGEAMYHANKAFQEAFTNALRNELSGTDIRVLELRPGCVATNFHSVRVGHDKEEYEQFFEGFVCVLHPHSLSFPFRLGCFADLVVIRPLVSEDIARAAIYMLSQRLNVSVKAMDVVPSGECLAETVAYALVTNLACYSPTINHGFRPKLERA